MGWGIHVYIVPLFTDELLLIILLIIRSKTLFLKTSNSEIRHFNL